MLQMMGACVRASNATEIQKARIDENITFMQDLMGGCERIFRTPIPLSYTRYCGSVVKMRTQPSCTLCVASIAASCFCHSDQAKLA